MTTIKITITIVLVLLASILYAQGGKISGTVTNDKSQVFDRATVGLVRAGDTTAIKTAISTKEGSYSFDGLSDGRYFIIATAVGHTRKVSKPVDLNVQQRSVQVPALVLVPVNTNMESVTVAAKRPLIEQRIDRTILNVDAAITNAGASALEVLEKAPGVSVDKDGNVSLKGKDAVLVMIDGRPTQLSGTDLAALLRGMNANQLDQIEIMTNPPARFDASGTAGVINIKTKKIVKMGLNGSVNATYSQGKYPKTAEGFNFNYRAGKVNLFTNLSHNYQKRYSILTIDRNIINNSTNSIENIFQQEANRVSSGNGYNVKLGADFFATKKTTLGAVINLNSRNLLSVNPNRTNILTPAHALESSTNAIVNNDADWKSGNANLNFRTVLNKAGTELTADLDFLKYHTSNDLFMENSYTDAAGKPYGEADTLTGVLPQDINLYSARVDYLKPLKKKAARFEAGIKSSIVRTDNDASYDSIQHGTTIHDFNRSNHFVYEENINAAYANLSTPLSKKLAAQLGVRLENTNAKGRQITTGEVFNRHYIQLFPTAYFQYKADDKNTFAANFGRRVTRPSYQSLNPFIRFVDRYTYAQGNPALKPSLSNNIEISHSWKNQVTTTLNYTRIKDIIQEVIQQKGREAYNRPQNVSALKQFGISISANTPFTKWWTSSLNVNVFRNNYSGTIGASAIDLSATSFVFNGTQQFKISKTFSAELNGMYRNGSLEGVLRVQSLGLIGAGISQQLWKNKGILRLTARDIFHTQILHGRSRYDNVDFRMTQVSETQVVSIGLTYNFSKGKKIPPVKRTAGSANEEQNRIGQ